MGVLPYFIFRKKHAIISIVFSQKLAFLMSIFSKFYENLFTISLKFLQEDILGILGTPTAAKVIVFINIYIEICIIQSWKYYCHDYAKETLRSALNCTI